MKLLVSDFDGTFKSDLKNLNINIKTIKRFMEDGNKFIIATARSFKSIKNETDIYDIDYDYLICNNGLITFDNQNNIINAFPLSSENLEFIYNTINKRNELSDLKLFDLYSHTVKNSNILELFAKFDSEESALDYKKYIEHINPEIQCIQMNKVLFIGNRLNKAIAISNISRIENIDKNDIYTIGDDINDLEMLQEFNGYKMLNCNKKLLFKGIKTTRQVHSLVKKISKKH